MIDFTKIMASLEFKKFVTKKIILKSIILKSKRFNFYRKFLICSACLTLRTRKSTLKLRVEKMCDLQSFHL